ncbi:phytoene desaturase family protein [Gordonia sp. CPCC 206044]|uniref:phytoene desaturase family protein n=1 Tax=Gordonia sp. CPCC 206044 TaxID=3140793 RepID=UPI003AF34C0F
MNTTRTSRPARVVVIGAGLSGLSAAATLTGAGHDVTVIDAAGAPGGLVRTETLTDPDTGEAYRFDTGATVLTMPELIDDALTALGVPPVETRQRLRLVDVDPSYVARFADGTDLTVARGTEQLVSAVTAGFGAEAGRGVRDLTDWLARLHAAEFDRFIDHNFARPTDLLNRRTLRATAELIAMGATRRLTPAVARHVKDERLQRVFTFQSLYAGVPPHRAAAIYGVIAHMDIGLGVSYPLGGMGRIGTVMIDALGAAGATVALSTRAAAIHRDGHTVTGVTLADGEVLPADAVIAATPIATVSGLLGSRRGGRRVRHSPSAFVIHGVIDRAVSQTWPGHHHTVDFGAAWAETFDDLTRFPGRPMRDPSFLITRPEFTDPTPGSREVISILAPCPNLAVADLPWTALTDGYMAECLHTLAGRGYHGIDGLRVLRVDHPGTWAAGGLPDGTPFGAAHTIGQTGPLRTPNRWPGLSNLFVAGSATIPGVGIPPVLVSGRLAAARVAEALASGRVHRRIGR